MPDNSSQGSMGVFIPNPPEADHLDILRKLLDSSIELFIGPDLPKPPCFNVLVAGRPEKAHLEASRKLEFLVIPFAGIPETTHHLMLEYPHINVHNLHHNEVSTAETALALLLAAAKFVLPYDKQFRSGDWSMRYEPNPSILLENKTAVILGYGHVGRRIGAYLEGMGMRVIGIRKSRIEPSNERSHTGQIYPVEKLQELLPQADVLIITSPLTEDTRGLIGERELILLPKDALLVNVGRGPIVEEKALYQALRDRRLAGAGIDVWYNYPEKPEERTSTQPSEYNFSELENVVMSPHRAGGSRETEAQRMKHLARTLNAIAREEPIPNKINMENGY